MTQLLDPALIAQQDLTQTRQGLGFGATTGVVVVTTNNFLMIVLKNTTPGFDLIVEKRSIQLDGATSVKATNYRNPSPLTGADVTTWTPSARRLSGAGSALVSSTMAGVSITSAMRSTSIPDGTAAVPTLIASGLQHPFNTDALVIPPGFSFGVQVGGPPVNGLGGAQTANMEITLSCMLLPVLGS